VICSNPQVKTKRDGGRFKPIRFADIDCRSKAS
jgi:hypothetical protein